MHRFLILISGFISMAAAADHVAVTLHDGKRVEGELLKDEPVGVTLNIPVAGKHGDSLAAITFAREKIRSVEKVASPDEQYQAYLATTTERPLEQLGLAVWCKDHTLTDKAVLHAKKAWELDPGHEKTTALLASLGWYRNGEVWQTEAEYLAATGKVRWRERIVTKEEAVTLEAEAAGMKADADQREAANAARNKAERILRTVEKLDRDLETIRKQEEELGAAAAEAKAGKDRLEAADRELENARKRADEEKKSEGVVSERSQRQITQAETRIAQLKKETDASERNAKSLEGRLATVTKRREAMEKERAEAAAEAQAAGAAKKAETK